jgi:hypothetical protein
MILSGSKTSLNMMNNKKIIPIEPPLSTSDKIQYKVDEIH